MKLSGPTWSSAWHRRDGWTVPALDVALAGALVVAGVVDTARHVEVHPWTELAAALAMGAIVLRTRAPLIMCLATSVGFVGYALLPTSDTPLWSFIGILVIGFAAGANLEGRRRVLGLVLLVAATYAVQIADAARAADGLSWAETYVTPPVIILAPALSGWLLQRSRHQTAEVRRLADELAVERELHAQAAAEAERGRLARELHDVISHSVSVMVVQVGAAEQLLPEQSPAREQIRIVRETGKEALGELRRQLGVLGTVDGTAVAPMPGLGELPRLVRSSGARMSCHGDAPTDTPPGLGLAVYRVVQEALTNASRYASGTPAHVRLVHGADGIEIEVTNGPGTPSGERGSGRGLPGMRERVEMYGGLLEAGRSGAGWRVHAWLPISAPPS